MCCQLFAFNIAAGVNFFGKHISWYACGCCVYFFHVNRAVCELEIEFFHFHMLFYLKLQSPDACIASLRINPLLERLLQFIFSYWPNKANLDICPFIDKKFFFIWMKFGVWVEAVKCYMTICPMVHSIKDKVKFPNSTFSTVYFLFRHLQWELANDYWWAPYLNLFQSPFWCVLVLCWNQYG